MNVTDEFEAHRAHLRGVALHMLGSPSDAEDAVQEAWLRAGRAAPDDVANVRGWLTTVVARICLDMLRARTSRRERPLDEKVPEPAAPGPEQDAALADSVGLALLVVLDKLEPPERLAFVLHDVFGVPFDEIATMLGRTSEATRQLASRARRRVQGAPEGTAPEGGVSDLAGRRAVVGRFLAALRAGDVAGLAAVLAPDVTIVADDGSETRGRAWARSAAAFSRHAAFIEAALVDGAPGAILAPKGKLQSALRFAIAGDAIVRVEIVAGPARVAALEVALLG